MNSHQKILVRGNLLGMKCTTHVLMERDWRRGHVAAEVMACCQEKIWVEQLCWIGDTVEVRPCTLRGGHWVWELNTWAQAPDFSHSYPALCKLVQAQFCCSEEWTPQAPPSKPYKLFFNVHIGCQVLNYAISFGGNSCPFFFTLLLLPTIKFLVTIQIPG